MQLFHSFNIIFKQDFNQSIQNSRWGPRSQAEHPWCKQTLSFPHHALCYTFLVCCYFYSFCELITNFFIKWSSYLCVCVYDMMCRLLPCSHHFPCKFCPGLRHTTILKYNGYGSALGEYLVLFFSNTFMKLFCLFLNITLTLCPTPSLLSSIQSCWLDNSSEMMLIIHVKFDKTCNNIMINQLYNGDVLKKKKKVTCSSLVMICCQWRHCDKSQIITSGNSSTTWRDWTFTRK